MTPLWITLAGLALAGLIAANEYAKRRSTAAFARSEITAADALREHGIGRQRVLLDVLARADWDTFDAAAVLRETGGDAKAAEAFLTGITHALSIDHIFGHRRLDREGVTAWVRLAMALLDAGVPRKDLPSTISDAITKYDVNLPLRYTAWAYAAGMGRAEATARWRTARVNMDGVRRMARDAGVNLSAPHALSAAAA